MQCTSFFNRLDLRISILIAVLAMAWCVSFIVAIKKVEAERTNKYVELELGKVDADIKNQHNRILNDILLEHDTALYLTLDTLFKEHNLNWIELQTVNNKKYGFGEKTGNMEKNVFEREYPIIYDGHDYGKLRYSKAMFSFIKQAAISKLWIYSSVLAMLLVFHIVRLFIKGQVVEPIKSVIDSCCNDSGKNLSAIIAKRNLAMEIKQLVNHFITMKENIDLQQRHFLQNANLISLGQSTAMVAHDVRKPLTSMKALLCALPEIKDNPAELKKVVTTVDRNISQTNAMLNDVLEFSRDATALDLKDNNSSGLITSALGDALRNHQGSDVRIEYDLKHQYALRSDVTRITRVLTNIIDNALDAMASPQTGKVTGTLHFETYDTEREGKKFGGIVIRDSGPGIPEEALARIFDPFFTKGKKGGTGLGLAICHRVISLHEGKIEARNRKAASNASGQQGQQGGAEFIIELPLGKDRVGPRESEFIKHSSELETFRKEEALRVDYGDTANTTEFLKINKERNRKSYLLIVDDEPLFRESVRATLNELAQVKDHVNVVEAESAETAFRIFDARVFDYVIADIDLGSYNMNGYDFAQMVLRKYPNTHVLIHSNKRKAELDRNVREIKSDKFMGFLPKPMRAEELLQFLACKTFEVDKSKIATVSEKKKILILNDDDALLVSFKILLKAPDVQVLPASNVSDALKHLTDQKVDVILSDINLGNNEPDGYDFLKKVRESHKDIPFYMVSGMSAADEEPKAKNLGATGYLQLPIETEMLKKLVQ